MTLTLHGTCKDCKFFRCTQEEDRFSAPRHRNKNYPNGYPYVKDEIKKGKLTQEQVDNETRDASENERQYHEPKDFKFVCTIRQGICNILNDGSRMNNKADNIIVDVSDDHGLEVSVGENFGCIHFKPKE